MTKRKYERRCSVCEIPFDRNNYYHGKLMTARDFQDEQCYFNEKRWLINRMVQGWGVVCGLEVYEEGGKVFVKPGLAIDCCGREISVCEDKEVQLIPVESRCHENKQKQDEGKFVICLEFHECKTEPINLQSITCDTKKKYEFNRIRDSFKIYIRPESDVDMKDPCRKICPLENKSQIVHNYLCEKLEIGCCECPERPCLVLAEITLIPSEDPKYPATVKMIDSRSKRKLVYSNPLLYDLIKCYHGDLPHVIGLNWRENGANLAWDEFNGTDTIYEKGVQVKFDRKMDEKTINPNTFLFLVKMEDSDTGNFRYDQVPGDVSYDEIESIATFKLTSEWLIDVYFGYSRIREKGGEFMVVLKGDFILSKEENGNPPKALDGNFIGGKLPSGNGTQGCDFVSCFSVDPKPEEKKKVRKYR